MERCYKRADESTDMESGEGKNITHCHGRVGPSFMIYSEA